MSAHQGSYASLVTIDGQTAAVLRAEAKKVLLFNHEWFEDFLDFTPVGQKALVDIFGDAIAVIEAVGWEPELDGAERFEIPLTAGHIEQLHKCRDDLDATNLDLLDDLEAAETDEHAAEIEAEMTANHLAMQTLDRLFTDYTHTITT